MIQTLRRRRNAATLVAALLALVGMSAGAGAGTKSGLRGSAQVSAQVSTMGSAVARCPSGKVVSGGFGAPGFTKENSPAVRIGSEAVGRREWRIDAVAMGGGDVQQIQPPGNTGQDTPRGGGQDSGPATSNIVAYAYCGKLGKIKARPTSVEIPPTTLGTATARCGRGQRVIAGGFNSPGFDVATSIGVIALTSHKLGKRRWTVGGLNVSSGDGQQPGAPGTLTAIAYCIKHGPRLITRSQQASVGPEQIRTIDVSCPPGSKAVSGGFDTNVGPVGEDFAASGAVESFRMPRAAGWTTSSVSIDDAIGATMTGYAYCLKTP